MKKEYYYNTITDINPFPKTKSTKTDGDVGVGKSTIPPTTSIENCYIPMPPEPYQPLDWPSAFVPKPVTDYSLFSKAKTRIITIEIEDIENGHIVSINNGKKKYYDQDYNDAEPLMVDIIEEIQKKS